MLAISEIVAAVAADFEARSISVPVTFGGWKKDYAGGGPRVLFDLHTYSSGPLGLPNTPGLQFTNDLETAAAARALFTRVQFVKVWVRAPAPPAKDPKRSENAEKATAALLHQVLRALYQIAHGSFGWGDGEWPDDDRQDFVYGSLTTFIAQFSIPVLDDEHPAIEPDINASTSQTIAAMPAGEVTVALTPEP